MMKGTTMRDRAGTITSYKGSVKKYNDTVGDDSADWKTSEGASHNLDSLYRNSGFGQAVERTLSPWGNAPGPLRVKGGANAKILDAATARFKQKRKLQYS